MNLHYPNPTERIAASAWKRLNLSAPVDLRAVCDFLGYTLCRDTLPPGFLGFFIRDDAGSQTVIVSESLPMIEQRYVTAHEIGHGVSVRRLPGAVSFKCSTYNRDDAGEREADRFARCLLVPAAQLVAAVTTIGKGSIKLGHHFGVSPDLISTRLYECGLLPDRRRR